MVSEDMSEGRFRDELELPKFLKFLKEFYTLFMFFNKPNKQVFNYIRFGAVLIIIIQLIEFLN